MRKLVSIKTISKLTPILGKDRVEMATIGGWSTMVTKKDFKEGDMCVFAEPDSIFPTGDPRWEFLVSKGTARIRTKKFKDGNGDTFLSQGVAFPMDILTPEEKDKSYPWVDGTDLTEILGVTKYDTEVAELPPSKFKPNPFIQGDLPDFIAKTDEERIQNIPEILTEWDHMWVATEKIDGTSSTYALTMEDGKITNHYICSHNRNMKIGTGDLYNTIEEKYHIFAALEHFLPVLGAHLEENGKFKNNSSRSSFSTIVLQGEIAGPGIQKNRLDLKEIQFFGFNLLVNGVLLDPVQSRDLMEAQGIPWVPIIGENWTLKNTSPEDVLLILAPGNSRVNPARRREGIVFRSSATPNILAPMRPIRSFKAVSPEYLDQNHCG